MQSRLLQGVFTTAVLLEKSPVSCCRWKVEADGRLLTQLTGSTYSQTICRALSQNVDPDQWIAVTLERRLALFL
jgi:hypothetical protein